MSEITGYSYQELIGMDGLSLISDDTRATVIHNINTGYEKPYEVKGVRKNGEIYPVRLEARNIPYQGKNVRVVEFRDLTETKRFEKEKENLEGQLLQAQKMEAVGKLAVPPFFGSSIKRQDQLSNIAAIHTLIWITEFRLPPNGVGR